MLREFGFLMVQTDRETDTTTERSHQVAHATVMAAWTNRLARNFVVRTILTLVFTSNYFSFVHESGSMRRAPIA